MIIMIRPTITKPPNDTVADVYGEVKLTCAATGSPQPTIHWFKLKDGKGISITNADPATLLIEEMGLDDRGLYHCEDTKRAGKDVSVGSVLNVKGRSSNCLYVCMYVCQVPLGVLQFNTPLQLTEGFYNSARDGENIQEVKNLILQVSNY